MNLPVRFDDCSREFRDIMRAMGTELPGGSKFCDICGTPVVGPAGTQSRFAAPESYTPKHLVEKILTPKVAFERERDRLPCSCETAIGRSSETGFGPHRWGVTS